MRRRGVGGPEGSRKARKRSCKKECREAAPPDAQTDAQTNDHGGGVIVAVGASATKMTQARCNRSSSTLARRSRISPKNSWMPP